MKIEEELNSTIERLLKGKFTSDPRQSRFPLPAAPANATPGIPYVASGVVVTPDMARDWILHRSIRRDVIPKELVHDEVVPNRKYLIGYAKHGAKKLQEDPNWWNKGTPQSAAFTPDGFLLDAQHRMTWCALSGVPVILPIAVNTPWSAWKDIDQQRRRAAHQMLDIPYASQAATIARHLLPTLRGNSATDWVAKGKDNNEEIIEICLGWPYFAEDQSWMKEIMNASLDGVPAGPLGAVCIGALAGGANPDDVQQFLNGLQPYTRINYITIGTDGGDPRQLLGKYFRRIRRRKDSDNRYNGEDQRSNVGTIRYAMNVWLARNNPKPIKIKTMQRWAASNDLPPLHNEDAIRAFHAKHVN